MTIFACFAGITVIWIATMTCWYLEIRHADQLIQKLAEADDELELGARLGQWNDGFIGGMTETLKKRQAEIAAQGKTIAAMKAAIRKMEADRVAIEANAGELQSFQLKPRVNGQYLLDKAWAIERDIHSILEMIEIAQAEAETRVS